MFDSGYSFNKSSDIIFTRSSLSFLTFGIRVSVSMVLDLHLSAVTAVFAQEQKSANNILGAKNTVRTNR